MTIWTNRRGIKIKDLDGDGEDKVIFPPMPYEHSAAGPALTDRIKKPAKGLVMNKGCIWRERQAGKCAAPRCRRCGVIVEERQQGRCPPDAAPPWAAARRPAG